MQWKKLGVFFSPKECSDCTHAMFPVVEILSYTSGKIRVYYTHRDKYNYGFPSYLEACISDEKFTILYNHDAPIMNHSTLGNFDDSGVNPTSIVKTSADTFLFYYGWNLGVTVPFRNSIGVAKKDESAIFFHRMFQGPILDRSKDFPGLCATPFVIYDDNVFKMWFASGEPWIVKDNQAHVSCNIAYAESRNGFDWVRHNTPAVRCDQQKDHVISTPCVIKDKECYRMWYSYRGEKYRIGYAESLDGKIFERKDEQVGITVSEFGWDSEMICYPCVFDLHGRRYMLYCGNEYGKFGFGWAILN